MVPVMLYRVVIMKNFEVPARAIQLQNGTEIGVCTKLVGNCCYGV